MSNSNLPGNRCRSFSHCSTTSSCCLERNVDKMTKSDHQVAVSFAAADSAIPTKNVDSRDRLYKFRRHHSTSYVEGFSSVINSNGDPLPHLAAPNFCIQNDLDSPHPSPNRSFITDSHTAYRKIIDEEITTLKLQLAKAQALADSLDHDLKQKNTAYMLLLEQHSLVKDDRLEKQKNLNQLETVVSQLQEHAREGGLSRAEMESRMATMHDNCCKLERIKKKNVNECRKLKRENQRLRQDLEGKAMENQGLKSENDWLKRQLWSEKGEIIESDNDSVKEISISGIRQFLSPPKQRRRHRRSRLEGTSELDDKDHDANDIHFQEDAEDRTAGYTSLTDFQLRSATESGIDPAEDLKIRKKSDRHSFITKLAIRHGVSKAEGGIQSPHSSVKKKLSNYTSNMPKQKERKLPSSRNTRERNSAPPPPTSLKGEQKQIHQNQESNQGQWNIWGMLTGAGLKSTDPEEKTKELSDSCQSSDDFVQSQLRSSIGSQLKAKPDPKQGHAKAGTVLMPKSFTSA